MTKKILLISIVSFIICIIVFITIDLVKGAPHKVVSAKKEEQIQKQSKAEDTTNYIKKLLDEISTEENPEIKVEKLKTLKTQLSKFIGDFSEAATSGLDNETAKKIKDILPELQRELHKSIDKNIKEGEKYVKLSEEGSNIINDIAKTIAEGTAKRNVVAPSELEKFDTVNKASIFVEEHITELKTLIANEDLSPWGIILNYPNDKFQIYKNHILFKKLLAKYPEVENYVRTEIEQIGSDYDPLAEILLYSLPTKKKENPDKFKQSVVNFVESLGIPTNKSKINPDKYDKPTTLSEANNLKDEMLNAEKLGYRIEAVYKLIKSDYIYDNSIFQSVINKLLATNSNYERLAISSNIVSKFEYNLKEPAKANKQVKGIISTLIKIYPKAPHFLKCSILFDLFALTHKYPDISEIVENFALEQFYVEKDDELMSNIFLILSETNPSKDISSNLITIIKNKYFADRVKEEAVDLLLCNKKAVNKDLTLISEPQKANELLQNLYTDELSLDIKLHILFRMGFYCNNDILPFLEKLLNSEKDGEICKSISNTIKEIKDRGKTNGQH